MLNRYKTLYHFTCQPQKSKTVSVIFAQQPWSCMAKTVCFHLHTVVRRPDSNRHVFLRLILNQLVGGSNPPTRHNGKGIWTTVRKARSLAVREGAPSLNALTVVMNCSSLKQPESQRTENREHGAQVALITVPLRK